MAGEWLKFEKTTLDKPEVFAIAVGLGLDPDTVIGKLVRVWAWFDSHTIDGNAPRVTPALLNRVAGNDGFIEAMSQEGWATIDADGVKLPHFERHNGETAKQRALTAKRVAKKRSSNGESNATGNGPIVTSALAREEKRREEVKQEQEHVQQAARDPADGLPEDIAMPQEPKTARAAPAARRTADRFPEFWAVYPVRKGKAEALKKWKLKGCDAIADKIIAHVRRMEREDDDWRTGFIPHGSTYINGERWEDEPKKDKPNTAPAPAPEKFGSKAALQTSESKLENALAYIRQQRQRGDLGEGEAADEEMKRLIAEATEKYRGAP